MSGTIEIGEQQFSPKIFNGETGFHDGTGGFAPPRALPPVAGRFPRLKISSAIHRQPVSIYASSGRRREFCAVAGVVTRCMLGSPAFSPIAARRNTRIPAVLDFCFQAVLHVPAQIVHILLRHAKLDIHEDDVVNAKGVRRSPRIKALHRQILGLAGKRKLATRVLAGKELRQRLLGRTEGTRHDLATAVAQRFSDELAARLPPKRRTWMSEDARMDIFEAVALAVAGQRRFPCQRSQPSKSDTPPRLQGRRARKER